MRGFQLILSLILIGIVSGVSALNFSNRKPASYSIEEDLKAHFRRPDRIPFPSHNAYSEEKYKLGKLLFFDPRISRSGSMSCATCHSPAFSWTDGLPKAVGDRHKILKRRAPTLLNLAWGESFFWDGRARSLEEQALGPIQSPDEMNTPIPKLIEKIRSISEYGPLFQKAFPGEGVSKDTIAQALATFERKIVSDIAPFDRWVEGEETAISQSAQRGFVLFNTTGCVRCHTGWNFTNGSFADTGLITLDRGRGKIEKDKDTLFAFKTPTLRNIARRGPYMHNGSFPTLLSVIEHYDRGGAAKRKSKEMFVQPLNLNPEQKKDLLAFLETLTSEDEGITLPLLPRE